jgi:hypothetical protein
MAVFLSDSPAQMLVFTTALGGNLRHGQSGTRTNFKPIFNRVSLI